MPLLVCWDTGFLQLDAVHGVLREEARDAAREAQALDRSAVEWEAAAQGGVLGLYGLQPVRGVVPIDVEAGHPGFEAKMFRWSWEKSGFMGGFSRSSGLRYSLLT